MFDRDQSLQELGLIGQVLEFEKKKTGKGFGGAFKVCVYNGVNGKLNGLSCPAVQKVMAAF